MRSSTLSGTIRLGMICDCSGSSGVSQGGSDPAIKAWAKWTNAHGGVNGHAVSVTVKDDASDPNQALAAAQSLVQQDHVVAIVGEASTVDYAFASYLSGLNIPVIGGITSSTPMSTNPDFFPTGTPIALVFYAVVANAKVHGLTKLNVTYCAEAPSCAQVVPLMKSAATITDSKIVSTGEAAAAAPSYTTQCISAVGSGAQAIELALATNVSFRVLTDCAQQGSKMAPLIVGSTYDSTWEKAVGTQGAVGVDGDFPFWVDQGLQPNLTNPATATYYKAIRKYAPKLPGTALNTSTVAYTWAGGQLFLAAAKAADIGPSSTGADIKNGLYKVSGTTLGGLAPPLIYTKGKPATISCYFTEGIKNDKFYSSTGLKPVCPSSANLNAYYKAIGG